MQRYPLGKTAAVVFLAMLLTAAAAISTTVLWPESGKRTFAADTLRYGPALLIVMNEKEPEETRRKRAMFRAFILMRNAIQALQAVRDQEGKAASHASSLLATLHETLLGPRLLDDQQGAWRHRLRDSLEPDIKSMTAGVGSDAVVRRQSVADQVELGILALKTVRKEDGAISKHARSYLRKLRTKLSN